MSNYDTAYPRYDVSDFKPGVTREQKFSVSREEVDRFSAESGDHHPLHCDKQFSQQRGYRDVLVHGMLVTARCSAFIARDFVGSHGLLVSMSSDFRYPVFCGDGLLWRGEVAHIDVEASIVEVQWQVMNIGGVVVQRGTACAWLSGQL